MIYVLYHANCYDGFCAAWVCWRTFGDDATYIPVQYGQELPEMESNSVVYIVDFSYDRATLEALGKRMKHVYVFDHHKTAQGMLKGDWPENMTVIFDLTLSGAQITVNQIGFSIDDTKHLYEQDWLIAYTADRDLWAWKLPDSKTINIGLRAFERDFEVWNTLEIGEAVRAGQVLETYFKGLIDGAVKNAKFITVGDRIIRAVNCTHGDIISDVAGAIAEEGGIGMTYFHDGESWVYSIRSRGEIDVSEIAKSYGGGGHPGAAGFRRDEAFPLTKGQIWRVTSVFGGSRQYPQANKYVLCVDSRDVDIPFRLYYEDKIYLQGLTNAHDYGPLDYYREILGVTRMDTFENGEWSTL